MKRLKILNLIDPEMCQSCRFAGSVVITENGYSRVQFMCKRLDCDNWIHDTAVPLTGDCEPLD